MPPDSEKVPDLMGSFAEMASFWMSLGNPYRSLMSALPTRHEVPNPTVQEIAIKAVLSAEISEREHKLAADK